MTTQDHTLLKYPRTPHIEGSGLQAGDHDLERVPFAFLRGKYLVVEEKLDGANVGISFDDQGTLRLQCRGHYLTGGEGERQFDLLKTWAQSFKAALGKILRTRYLMYGEWLYAKHTVFYDCLPHYFMEFDTYDRETGAFLSTERRNEMYAYTPIVSVPVVRTGALKHLKELTAYIKPSLYKTAQWRDHLREGAFLAGANPETVLSRETDNSDLSEGLYLKWEDENRVLGRYKWVRGDFIQSIKDSGTHWRDRPLIKNGLRAGFDMFAP